MPKLISCSTFLIVIAAAANVTGEVRFSRDVLPILSDRCFHCHGSAAADESSETDLRLDNPILAKADRGGSAAIVPGDIEASELIARVTSDDPDVRMPPADSHRKPLSENEVETLRKWIAEGAVWGKHWSFERPSRPELPDSGVHPIDALVEARLRREGMQLSKPAARYTLARRLSFDIVGLPPTTEELDLFLSDNSSKAYDNYVTRLLSSPHYGERMAMWWLDAARYADTDGYQGDATRTNWPWRDWVVQAFNSNKRFDEFTIEQFAGDLLPDATEEQRLATCFHRNHMTNGEGGRHPEESRIDYVIDRVNTTGTVWLGLTLGCAQCHSHKFDPISQHDYYSLFAFFNSIDEDGKAGTGATPFMKYRSPYADRAVDEMQRVVDQRVKLEAEAKLKAEAEFTGWLESQIQTVADGFQPWHTLQASQLESVEGSILTQSPDGIIKANKVDLFQDDYQVTAPSDLKQITGIRLEVFSDASHTQGKYGFGESGEFILTDVKLQVRSDSTTQVRDIELASAVASLEKGAQGRRYGNVRDTLDDDPRNGWTAEGKEPQEKVVAVFALAEPLKLSAGEQVIFVMLQRSTTGHANIASFRLSVTDQVGEAVRKLEPMPLEQLAASQCRDADSVDTELRQRLLDQFLFSHQDYQMAKGKLDRAKRQLNACKKATEDQNVMVLAERKERRESHVLVRGVWDQKGEVVKTAVPSSVLPMPAEKVTNRLDLAKWLVSNENPLTARVVVNHLWQMFFGVGLVRTTEDFGLQGEQPTHPELLDWLAVELMDNDWDLQHIIRLIVTSKTYQQSSALTSASIERDPNNRLLARQSRFRLPSWMLRDAALRSSGLLNPALGGPPIRPYQPSGVWAEIFMGRFRYEPSEGPAQNRRTLYAFWRRSSAPVFLFDNAQRRVCEVSLRRTNTPLHALTMLNDETRLEASASLARLAIAKQSDADARLSFIFRSVLSRFPDKDELSVLKRQQTRTEELYGDQPEEARKLLQSGHAPSTGNVAVDSETASYMIVASLLLNLDEAITHE